MRNQRSYCNHASGKTGLYRRFFARKVVWWQFTNPHKAIHHSESFLKIGKHVPTRAKWLPEARTRRITNTRNNAAGKPRANAGFQGLVSSGKTVCFRNAKPVSGPSKPEAEVSFSNTTKTTQSKDFANFPAAAHTAAQLKPENSGKNSPIGLYLQVACIWPETALPKPIRARQFQSPS